MDYQTWSTHIPFTDRGSADINVDMAQLCTLMGIYHFPRAPYSPWTNSLVEVQYLGSHIRMTFQITRKDWSCSVHMYPCAHGSQPLSALIASPREIVFHTRPQISLKFDLKLNRNTTKNCISKYCCKLPERSHYDKTDF